MFNSIKMIFNWMNDKTQTLDDENETLTFYENINYKRLGFITKKLN